MLDSTWALRMSTRRTWFRLLSLVALALALSASEARAGLVVFAQFTERDPAAGLQFTAGGASASFRTASEGVPITFHFTSSLLPDLPPSLAGPQDAHLILDLTTNTPASSLAPLYYQPFTSQIGTLKIVRDTDRQTLLAVDFTGSLHGVEEDYTGYLSGRSDSGTVRYSSDYLNFDATTLRSLGITLSSPDALTLGGTFLDNFGASAVGAFSVNGPLMVVPEPSTLVTGGLGAVALALIVRRQRRRRAAV